MPTLTREQQDVLHDENEQFERDVDEELSRVLVSIIDELMDISESMLEDRYGFGDANHRKAQVLAAVARRIQKIAAENGGEH